MSRLARPIASCVLAGVAAVAACGDGTLIPAPARGVAEVRLVGAVRGPAGEAVGAAPVAVTRVLLDNGPGATTFGRCRGFVTPNALSGQTDGTGRFQVLYRSIRPEFLCFVFDVSATVGGKVMTGRAELDSILLSGPGLDSLPVVVVVR